jgi:hypothetical protein
MARCALSRASAGFAARVLAGHAFGKPEIELALAQAAPE